MEKQYDQFDQFDEVECCMLNIDDWWGISLITEPLLGRHFWHPLWADIFRVNLSKFKKLLDFNMKRQLQFSL